MATAIKDSPNPWPRVGTCEMCAAENTVLRQSPNGKWCCADEHACFERYCLVNHERKARRALLDRGYTQIRRYR